MRTGHDLTLSATASSLPAPPRAAPAVPFRLHDFALALADAPSRKGLPPRGGKFPTGAMATFCFDGTWNELRPGSAVVAAFTPPKEMASQE